MILKKTNPASPLILTLALSLTPLIIMPATIEKITESLELGEGPHWDAPSQSLYFVDIFGKFIHKYIPESKLHTKAIVGEKHVSFIIPIEGQKNKFLLGYGRELVTVDWEGLEGKVRNLTKIAEVENSPETINNRFNDAKCDPNGKLWAGTMGEEKVPGHVTLKKGGLYSLTPDKKLIKHLSNISISNGLAWSSDLKKFYYIDSPKKIIEQFDYDSKKGAISNPQTIFSLEKHDIPGVPDGMAIDKDGNLWIAIFNGYRVIKIDPRKSEALLETVEIPAKQVTSVAFGGKNLDELYVTTASFIVDGVELSPPDHGATYVIRGVGVVGLPGVGVKL